MKKIRHLMKIVALDLLIVIYINHDVVLKITKQISLIISFINKLNLRLVRVFDYFQRFNLNIRHKFDKQHIIFNALSRLIFNNINFVLRKFIDEEKLDILTCTLTKFLTNDEFLINDTFLTNEKSFAENNEFMLFIIFLIEMSSDFKQQILKNYKFNLNWQRISDVLKVNSNDDENVVKLFFY